MGFIEGLVIGIIAGYGFGCIMMLRWCKQGAEKFLRSKVESGELKLGEPK